MAKEFFIKKVDSTEPYCWCLFLILDGKLFLVMKCGSYQIARRAFHMEKSYRGHHQTYYGYSTIYDNFRKEIVNKLLNELSIYLTHPK